VIEHSQPKNKPRKTYHLSTNRDVAHSLVNVFNGDRKGFKRSQLMENPEEHLSVSVQHISEQLAPKTGQHTFEAQNEFGVSFGKSKSRPHASSSHIENSFQIEEELERDESLDRSKAKTQSRLA
jgi:hypothetical protein